MTYISSELRRAVRERAEYRCEYCLLHEEDSFLSHEVDHIIAEKHHGETNLSNLCLSCFDCNRNKGSDIASIDLETNALTPLYNPRLDTWSEHFRLNGALIEPLTAVGRVTISLLRLNSGEQLQKRTELIDLRRYP